MFFFSLYLSYIHIIISRGHDQERFCSASLKNCCVGIHLYIGNLIFFHPTCLFRPTRLIFLQNCLPNMLIQDNMYIRNVRVPTTYYFVSHSSSNFSISCLISITLRTYIVLTSYYYIWLLCYSIQTSYMLLHLRSLVPYATALLPISLHQHSGQFGLNFLIPIRIF